MKIFTVIGARPQFIKAAVLSRLIKREYSGDVQEYLVHTGQHYDTNMSWIFFEEMEIPEPDINLDIGSGLHGKMTGQMLCKIEKLLLGQKPDTVLVYGDTNSTLAGALAASKLNIPVTHIEAGLRSYFKKMPEEQNRVLTDHISTLLFCPTDVARENLKKENITQNVHVVGDIMLDASLHHSKRLEETPGCYVSQLPGDLPDEFYLLTIHRAENTDDEERLDSIVKALNSYSEIPAVFPVHPRTKAALQRHGLKLKDHIRQIDAVGYLDMLTLEKTCRFIVTDSGGVQKEAYFMHKPCITLRDQTEWVETVDSGWNTVAGVETNGILDALTKVHIPDARPAFYGNGNAGKAILETIMEYLS